MTKPPAVKSESHVYLLSPVEVEVLLAATDPKNPESAYALGSKEFRVDQSGKNQKCPADGIEDGKIIRYTSAFQKYAPLFIKHGSITATTMGQLRDALVPYAPKKHSPSTPPHVCVEVKTESNGSVKISAWNPFAGPKK